MPTLPQLLSAHGLEQYLQVFIDNDVDAATLRILTDADLKELGLPFGARKRLLERRRRCDRRPARPPEEERRQLTVMFCDIVGFADALRAARPRDPQGRDPQLRGRLRRLRLALRRLRVPAPRRRDRRLLRLSARARARGRAGDPRGAARSSRRMPRLALPEGVTLAVRIGLASGIVVVSSDGAPGLRRDDDLAARLQAVATPRRDRGQPARAPARRRRLRLRRPRRARAQGHLRAAPRPPGARRCGWPTTRPPAEVGAGRPRRGDGRARRALAAGARQRPRPRGRRSAASPASARAGCRRRSATGSAPTACGSLRFQCSPFHVNSAFHPITAHLEARAAASTAR